MVEDGTFTLENIINEPNMPFAILSYRCDFVEDGEDEFEEYHVHVGAGGIWDIYACDYGEYLFADPDDEGWAFVIKELSQLRVLNDMLNFGQAMIGPDGVIQVPMVSEAD